MGLRQERVKFFKKHVLHDLLLLILEAEDNYVEMPILLYKIANFTYLFIRYMYIVLLDFLIPLSLFSGHLFFFILLILCCCI